MPLTDAVINGMLNHTFCGVSFTQPTAWYAQLHYGAPGSLCTGNVWTAAGRVAVTDFSTATVGTLDNAAAISWVNVPDPGANDTIYYVSFFGAATDGTALAYGSLTTPRYADSGDILTIAISELDITVI